MENPYDEYTNKPRNTPFVRVQFGIFPHKWNASTHPPYLYCFSHKLFKRARYHGLHRMRNVNQQGTKSKLDKFTNLLINFQACEMIFNFNAFKIIKRLNVEFEVNKWSTFIRFLKV